MTENIYALQYIVSPYYNARRYISDQPLRMNGEGSNRTLTMVLYEHS